MAAAQSTKGRWSWPWLQFFAAREAERSGGIGAVEVVLRVTGTGLENVNVVDLATGAGSSVRAHVVRKPTNTLLLPPGTVVPPGAAGGAVARTMAWPLRLFLGPLLEGWQVGFVVLSCAGVAPWFWRATGAFKNTHILLPGHVPPMPHTAHQGMDGTRPIACACLHSCWTAVTNG